MVTGAWGGKMFCNVIKYVDFKIQAGCKYPLHLILAE